MILSPAPASRPTQTVAPSGTWWHVVARGRLDGTCAGWDRLVGGQGLRPKESEEPLRKRVGGPCWAANTCGFRSKGVFVAKTER